MRHFRRCNVDFGNDDADRGFHSQNKCRYHTVSDFLSLFECLRLAGLYGFWRPRLTSSTHDGGHVCDILGRRRASSEARAYINLWLKSM